MRQLILDLLPEAPPCLANFVVGSNAEALTGLAAWLAESGEHSLFIWGESGAGKTHLLRAVGGVYLDAAAAGAFAEIENPGATPALYAIDNVEALAADGQIALFNLFNRLRAAGGKLLTSAQRPPLALALREDLRTRLGSGLIYRLQPLSEGEQLAALSAQAAARGLPLPPDACSYLLARAPRDMRSLSALLAALDRYSLEHKRAITLPLLREVLQAPIQ